MSQPPVDLAAHASHRVTGTAPPGPELDRYLDALTACIARSGLRRLSVQDVARELGVDRTTVYRQAGTIRSQLRLLAARDVGRLLASPPIARLLADPAGSRSLPDQIVEAMSRSVELIRRHPVVARLLDDESDLVTMRSLMELSDVLSNAAAVLAPALSAAMGAGAIRERDPEVLAGWIVHTTAWMVFMPPPGDRRAVLDQMVGPVLR